MTINNKISADVDEFEISASSSYTAVGTHSDFIHDASASQNIAYILSEDEEKQDTYDVKDSDVSESITLKETTKTNISATYSSHRTLTIANQNCQMDDTIFVSTFQEDRLNSTMTIKISDCDTVNNSKYTSDVDDLEASSHFTYDTHDDDDDEGDSTKDEGFKVSNTDKIISITPTIHQGDDGNCLPTVQEISHQSDHHNHVHRSRRHILKKKSPLFGNCGGALMSFMISFVIASVFLLLLCSMIIYTSNRTPSSSGEVTTSTEDQRFTANYNRTMEYLTQNNISSSISLLTYGSPQYYATSYIANQLQLPVPLLLPTDDDVATTTSTYDAALIRQEQTYRYIARYVLALDYYYFTNYNLTIDHGGNNQIQEDKEIVDPPQFINFITAGMDICQWNIRSQSATTTTSSLGDLDYYYDTRAIQMGVICSVATKLPVNLTISMFLSIDSTACWPLHIILFSSLVICLFALFRVIFINLQVT